MTATSSLMRRYKGPGTRLAGGLSAGTCAVVLAVLSTASPALANFPGSNGRIVFTVQGQIYSALPSGGGIRQLTHVTGDQGASVPKVSAAGRRIVYMSDESGSAQVWVMRLDGSHQHEVSNDPDHDAAYPTWSPAGRIAFARCSHALGTCRIATMNARGGDIREVTHGYWHDGTGADGGLVASPDGREIAFSSDRGGYNSRLWVVGADGSGLRVLSPMAEGESWVVDWSPDGTRILGGAGPRSCCLGFTVHVDGNGYRVVREEHDFFAEAYSPDGTKILAQAGPRSALSIMDADGTHLHPIPGLELADGEFGGAAWAPR